MSKSLTPIKLSEIKKELMNSNSENAAKLTAKAISDVKLDFEKNNGIKYLQDFIDIFSSENFDY